MVIQWGGGNVITRRQIVIALAFNVFTGTVVAFAQPQAKVWRIGFLGVQTAAGYARHLEAFRGGLKDFGYVEGKNVVVEYRWAEGVNERLPQLAAELLREKVDVLVTHATTGARAAHHATTTVPIVIASLGSDPVSMGLAKSLARPGGNITGTLSFSGTLAVKQLELVKNTLPGARKVAFMVTLGGAGGQISKDMEAAAKTLKLDLQLARVSGAHEFEAVIATMAERRVDALVLATGPNFIPHYGRIAALAARQRIPALGDVNFADSGGLMGYGANVLNNYRRAAYFIDRIFKGAKPADLPIEQEMTIELVVNLKTAKALGIRIPDVVMTRADRVIE